MINVRLFIGIALSPVLQVHMEEIIAPLEGQKTLKTNLHLTLEFLGELDDKQVPIILECMENGTFKPFFLTFNRMNLLRDMLVLEVESSEELLRLQSDLHNALETKGFELETRPYYPHITLVRKYHGPIVPFSPVQQEVRGFHLYSSSRINGILTYTVIATTKSQ